VLAARPSWRRSTLPKRRGVRRRGASAWWVLKPKENGAWAEVPRVCSRALMRMPRVRRRWVLAVALLVATLGMGAVPSLAGQPLLGQALLAQTTVDQATVEQQSSVSRAFSGTTAKQHVDALAAQIGSRPAGSANYDQAVQYVADQLRQAGYQPTLQAFPVQTYDDRGSQLELSAAGGSSAEPTRFTVDTLTYSVAGQVEGPLVVVPGVGEADDLQGVDVRGKIALVKRGTLRFSDKVANAAAAGAVGVIVYNDGPGRVQGSLLHTEAVPAVTMSGDDGQRLVDLAAAASAPLVLRLAVDGSIEQGAGTNVLAELPGSAPGAGSVVIGAHLDSVRAGPGANDNGSGSAVVLELARTLAQQAPSTRPYTIRFALFGAEELGLFGSRYYVDALSPADRSATVAMLNLDMIGVGTEWRFGGSDDLVQLALGAANDLGQRALPLRGPLGSASDHASFVSAGIPAIFFYRSDDPNYHTANDRAEFVDADALGNAGEMALRVLRGLAQH
jgi:aminopeptidase YwaD